MKTLKDCGPGVKVTYWFVFVNPKDVRRSERLKEKTTIIIIEKSVGLMWVVLIESTGRRCTRGYSFSTTGIGLL